MGNMIDDFNEKVRKIKEQRRQPGANKKTEFERRRTDIYKLLDEALNLLYDLPFDKTNEDFKTAKARVWSAKQQIEKLGTQVGKGYGWTLVEDEYPVNRTGVYVSLKDEGETMLALYDKDKGFLGYERDLEAGEVIAWCEIPEWYDWTYQEPELTEEEKKDNYYDMKFHELQEHGEI